MNNSNSVKKFDLNIEEVLENWEIYHALREIIANALDEQILTKTQDIQITKEGDLYKIRDYGRGIKYYHLTQNESQEKLNNPDLVIGKFGVGLKDALATLDRHKIDVKIRTKHGDITIEKTKKHGFDDILTLHAVISEPTNSKLIGTEFILKGCTEQDVSQAKSLFLKFSNEKLLEKTKFGDILEKKSSISNIYINGVKVAEEENFLFSYNITSITPTMRKSLNRERTNVGRTAYTDRIKSILLSSVNHKVSKLLVGDLSKYEEGTQHDELKYIDVCVHACRNLNLENKVIFVTPNDQFVEKDLIDNAKRDGFEVIIIPDSIKEKIQTLKDPNDNPIRDISQYKVEYLTSFEFKFIELNELTNSEKKVFDHMDKIMKLVGGKPAQVNEIKVSETMRVGSTVCGVAGVWIPEENMIVIQRNQLSDLGLFAGTLLHEVAHAQSGYDDVNRDFELVLSDFLGKIYSRIFSS